MKRFKVMALALVICAATVDGVARSRTAKGVFVVGVGREKKVEGADLRIGFLAVTEDSRCPEGARCIRAGDARTRMTVRASRGERVEFELSTNRKASEFRFGEYTIRLQRLTPHPSTTSVLKPEKYAAELFISKPGKK